MSSESDLPVMRSLSPSVVFGENVNLELTTSSAIINVTENTPVVEMIPAEFENPKAKKMKKKKKRTQKVSISHKRLDKKNTSKSSYYTTLNILCTNYYL